MQDSAIGSVEPLLLLLLLLVSALAILAKRLQIAYPIVMVIGGLFLSLLPHAPRVSLDPNIVFLVILPPLLFLAAFHTSWREFRRNILNIVMLAFGLVSFTIFGSAAAVHWLVPGFDWRLGCVLGSVIAATDAIAASASVCRAGLPNCSRPRAWSTMAVAWWRYASRWPWSSPGLRRPLCKAPGLCFI
jgi:CPA1 family monovalent cation:H+ antiporter